MRTIGMLFVLLFLAGCATEKEFIPSVQIVDTPKMSDLRPRIVIVGGPLTVLVQGEKFEDLGATATDFEDGDISYKIKKSGNVDPYKPGGYSVMYYVEDSNNSPVVAKRMVIVLKK